MYSVSHGHNEHEQCAISGTGGAQDSIKCWGVWGVIMAIDQCSLGEALGPTCLTLQSQKNTNSQQEYQNPCRKEIDEIQRQMEWHEFDFFLKKNLED